MSPYEYGKKAFKDGKPCVPACDSDFLKEYCNGEVGTSIGSLKGWIKGWTELNIKEPIN